MRQIKFRFWTPDKRMIEDHDGWVEGIGINEALISSKEYGCIAMQFTNLTDKNGVEIYEGDVVKIHNYNTTWKNLEPSFDWRIFEIKYNVCTWAFSNDAIYMPMSNYDTKYGTPYEIEVIGNIYENPELLNSMP